jgi:hypothetical protein
MRSQHANVCCLVALQVSVFLCTRSSAQVVPSSQLARPTETVANPSVDSKTTVTFVSRGMQGPFEPGHEPSAFGHVFMIISTPVYQGITKDDAFGFYPSNGSGIIKGNGMLRSEFNCKPTDDCNVANNKNAARISEIQDSVSVKITEDQRKQVLDEVNKWDDKQSPKIYRVVPGTGDDEPYNCIDFVNAVVKRLGYPTPERGVALPGLYLANLKSMIQKEDAKRAFEAATARQRALDAEMKTRAEEAARAAEADRIPLGWMQCSCPQYHSNLGKWVRGVLYHSPTIRCPN